MNYSRRLWIAAVGCWLIASPGWAANKLKIDPQSVSVGDTGVSVPILLDNDQKLYGFSLSITTDASLLKMTGMDLAGTAASGAGWSFGQVLISGSRLSWGVVLDITEPFDLNNVIPVGANIHIANLKVDVTATAAGSAQMTFQDFPAAPPSPATKNLLVGDEGVSLPFTSSNGAITIQSETTSPQFRRGDADTNGKLELTDAIRILGYLFLGTGTLSCNDAADSDNNGTLELTDAVRILNFLFQGGGAPPSPGPPPNPCGPDPAGGVSLGCDNYSC